MSLWVSGILRVRYAVWQPLLRIVINALKRGSNSLEGGRTSNTAHQGTAAGPSGQLGDTEVNSS